MPTARNIFFAGCLLASPMSLAALPSLTLNYVGLGNSPIGLELKKASANWSIERTPRRVQEFLKQFRDKHSPNTELQTIFEEAGLMCTPSSEQKCSYAGVYTYETERDNGKVQRSAVLIDISIDFKSEPWKVIATRRYLYGAPANWDQL